MRSLCAMVCGVLLIAVTASAQTVTITSGSVFLYWDGSLSGFQLSAPGTQLVGEVLQGSAVILQDGAVADLSHTVSAYTNSNHPFTEQVNGTTYPSVWIRASLSFTATPLYVPGGTDGALTSFSTPFTMSGQFAGFSDQAMTQQVFSVSLQGAGIITVGTLRQFAGSGSGAWALIGQGGTAFGFTSALPSPWTAADVGNVGTAGVSSYSNGEFYVAGAGSDIWGNADAFQFVSQPLAGDGSIVAQLDGLDLALSPFAKAGVMIRQSMSADSAHVLLDVKPDGGVELLTRSAAGGATTFVAGATVTGRPWLRLTRSGSAVTAALSPDGSTWTTVGSATLGGNALIGLAVTSHSTAYLDQAQFEQVTVTSAGAGGSLPLSWSQADVGVVGQAGSGSAVGGTFTVAGSGSDIWGSADAFHYVYTSDQGSGSIVARVVSVSDTNTFAKAGIMFRNSLDAGATHVILDVRPDGSLEFMTRSTSGQATTFIASAQTTFPVTLKLERTSGPVDSLFVASFLDPGGSGWQPLGSVSIPIGPDALVGLAVTSHDTTLLNTSIFDTVEVVRNLLVDGDFEGYSPPALGPPGWISDQPLRMIAAVSDSSQPHSGSNDGLCSQSTFQDCGLYQEVTAPASGSYVFSVFANASHSNGWVGVNVNGSSVQALPVDVRQAGDYGASPYTIAFNANAGDTIRVWMYSPPTPGWVVIDDATLEQDFSAP